jgi:hypothetical protein
MQVGEGFQRLSPANVSIYRSCIYQFELLTIRVPEAKKEFKNTAQAKKPWVGLIERYGKGIFPSCGQLSKRVSKCSNQGNIRPSAVTNWVSYSVRLLRQSDLTTFLDRVDVQFSQLKDLLSFFVE